MRRPAETKTKGRITPLPKTAKNGKPPALDFMQLSSDAITFLRYAKTVERQLLEAAPDVRALQDIEECLSECGKAMSRLMTARQHTLGRYSPDGSLKPRQEVS